MLVNAKSIFQTHCLSSETADIVFKCEQSVIIAYRNSYMYLRITISEHLGYNNITTKVDALSAGRVFGLLIAKYRSCGGLPYDVYTRLFNPCIVPVIAYGASIRGVKSYPCINAVHNRAMRFLLGTGKYNRTQLYRVKWPGNLYFMNSEK